jgi:endonuclease YncB( thermonuclease family)
MKELIVLNTEINSLITTIKDEIVKGKERAEQTIEKEKTTTYWNIGKHIHDHLLHHKERADYGDALFKIIAKELNMSKRALYVSVQFYETYPRIVHVHAQLTWSHYKILITIKDIQKRREFEKKVIEENLSTRELQHIVREYRKEKGFKKGKHLKETRGLLNTYPLKLFTENGNTTLYIDLGFRMYINKLDRQDRYTETDIVQVGKNGKMTIIIEGNLQKRLFTYKGYVKEIIDGDTLWATIDLGFNSRTTQKVRLRGINTPKIETEQGKKALNYLKRRLKPCPFIILKTYYRDTYNRYVADIFYDKNEQNDTQTAKNGVFLNQELLDKGYAQSY